LDIPTRPKSWTHLGVVVIPFLEYAFIAACIPCKCKYFIQFRSLNGISSKKFSIISWFSNFNLITSNFQEEIIWKYKDRLNLLIYEEERRAYEEFLKNFDSYNEDNNLGQFDIENWFNGDN